MYKPVTGVLRNITRGELARPKAWKFGANTETMNAQQRQMFENTLAEGQGSLDVQLRELEGQSEQSETLASDNASRAARRLPEHLRRVNHHQEPEITTCQTPDCRQSMVHIGKDRFIWR